MLDEVSRFQKALPLGELARKRLRGQARCERDSRVAIGRLFVGGILSLRLYLIVSILALSVTFGDTSPKGRGLGGGQLFVA
jgi:hypothetical protein